MNIVKRNPENWPFDLMSDWQDEMGRLFSRSLVKNGGWLKTFEPEIDMVEGKDSFTVKADMPGIKKEELDIRVEGKLLTLKGERKEEKEEKDKNYYRSERTYGSFSRTIELPFDIKGEEVKATYKDGVLEIVLPKTESAKAKQISVQIK